MISARGASSSPVVAVIDIGTNSVKLLIARCDGTRVTTLHFERATTRIGEGLGTRGRIDPAAAARTLDSVRSMVATAKRRGASGIVAVGTHAFRAARNGPAVAGTISRGAGVDVRILRAREEAELAFLSVSARFERPRPATFLLDIGGGSVEFVVATGRRIVSAKSAPLGALRMTERHIHSDPIDRLDEAALRREIDEAVDRLIAPHRDLARSASLVATGGAATTVLDMLRRRRRTPAAPPAPLGLGELRALEAVCFGLTLSERRRLPGLPADRADIMPAGLAVVVSFMEHARKRIVRVCEGGIRDGVILTMSRGASTARGSGRSRA